MGSRLLSRVTDPTQRFRKTVAIHRSKPKRKRKGVIISTRGENKQIKKIIQLQNR